MSFVGSRPPTRPPRRLPSITLERCPGEAPCVGRNDPVETHSSAAEQYPDLGFVARPDQEERGLVPGNEDRAQELRRPVGLFGPLRARLPRCRLQDCSLGGSRDGTSRRVDLDQKRLTAWPLPV